MKSLRFLRVVVLATLVLVSGFHFFWILGRFRETTGDVEPSWKHWTQCGVIFYKIHYFQESLVPQTEIFGRPKVLHFGKSGARLSNLSSVQRDLTRLHRAVETCLLESGDGLKATKFQGCKIRLQYPNGTENSWVYRRPETGAQVQEAESLAWDYNLCSLMKFWKKARTRPAVVTQEVFDCYLKEDTPKRVRYHFVSRFLPVKQPFAPGRGGRCALVGNAASLKSNVTLGQEIDAHDTVIRVNDARTGEKYVKWTGQKTTFRFVNEKITKVLVPLIRKTPIINETIVLRRALGGSTLKKLQYGSMGNPIYVSPITEAGSGLEADPILGYSSGFLALNFAISICKSVDVYGFSVDPGPQSSWPRYFSGPKFGHMPLTNRAYLLLLECLRVVRLKSAARILSGTRTTLPDPEVINDGYNAAKASLEENEPGEEPFNLCHSTDASFTRNKLESFLQYLFQGDTAGQLKTYA